MKSIFIIILASMSLFSQNKNEPRTVSYVDLKKYTGKWYEIAKIPNSFQEDCIKNTTAEYRINEDGEIEVLNGCTEADGTRNTAKGIARVIDKKTNSRLEVSFVNILGLHLFWGDYWIIGLADDYRYAVIGHPERKYGWILSRTPQMSTEDLDQVFAILESNGYRRDRFEMSQQK